MEDNIQEKLEKIRVLMIESGVKKGLLHENTVRLSREFDHLMNIYEKSQLNMNKKRKKFF